MSWYLLSGTVSGLSARFSVAISPPLLSPVSGSPFLRFPPPARLRFRGLPAGRLSGLPEGWFQGLIQGRDAPFLQVPGGLLRAFVPGPRQVFGGGGRGGSCRDQEVIDGSGGDWGQDLRQDLLLFGCSPRDRAMGVRLALSACRAVLSPASRPVPAAAREVRLGCWHISLGARPPLSNNFWVGLPLNSRPRCTTAKSSSVACASPPCSSGLRRRPRASPRVSPWSFSCFRRSFRVPGRLELPGGRGAALPLHTLWRAACAALSPGPVHRGFPVYPRFSPLYIRD